LFSLPASGRKSLESHLVETTSGIPPPTHSIKVLLDLLPSPLSPPPNIIEAAQLSNYTFKGRYPLDFVDVPPDEYEKALRQADEVLRWTEKL
jgi:HEPN domain-containing protein